VKPRANGRSPVTCNTNNHGSGLSPDPPPFPIITTHDFKYKRVHIIFKEHRRESWLAECYEVVGVGGGPGVEPHSPQYILYKKHLANKRGTRGAHGLGHVSSHYSPTIGHVSSTDSPETNQTTTAMSSPYGLYDPATSPYGLYGQVQSALKNFACLAWRTDRDISSIRTPFAKVNIPLESGRRDGHNGTVFVAFRAL
jgi:hypothetical protein